MIQTLGATGKDGGVKAIGFALSLIALLAAFSCFHFTEGQKKGGFGSFPVRLFNQPITTRWLVGLPMVYGSVAVIAVYLLCVALIFAPLGLELPLLWPSLYLVFGLTQFQWILWSFPDNRYLKLFLLCFSGSIITFGWMFFLPNIYRGTLSSWEYTGDPDVFIQYFFGALALTGPLAYGISLHSIHRQRHGLSGRLRLFAGLWERMTGCFFKPTVPFPSADSAVLLMEWRRSGFILPIVVLVVMGMSGIPSWLSDDVSENATLGFLFWFLVSPFLFSSIIGRGFGKPDFWSQELRISPFHAILPMTSGPWVISKMKVAFWSVVITWGMVFYLSFLWVSFAGDFGGLEAWFRRIQFYYSSVERWGLLLLSFPTLVVMTWRFLVSGLAVGMSGRKIWFFLGNLWVGFLCVALFVCLLWQSDNEQHALRLYHFWPWIEKLPFLLIAIALAKIWLAVFVWNLVCRLKLLPIRSAAFYGLFWFLAMGVVTSFFFILCRNTLWLRSLLMLGSIIIVPLAGPALAMVALERNRSNS